MWLVICNHGQVSFFERLLLPSEGAGQDVSFICDEAQLNSLKPSDFTNFSLIVVNSSLSWGDRLLQHNYGLDIGMALRRDYLVKCPIVFFSLLDRAYFETRQNSDQRNNFLNANGTGFFSYPLARDSLIRQIRQTASLTETSHREIVIEYCGLQKRWNYISHRLRELIPLGRRGRDEAHNLLTHWAPVLYSYYPESTEAFETLQGLMMRNSRTTVHQRSVTLALERLNLGIKYGVPTKSQSNQNERPVATNIPTSPPTGYSKILIADDKPSPLLETLSDKYRYDVLRPQSFNYSDAKRRLLSDRPNVVLADYYFPKEESGRRFMTDALDRPASSGLRAVICVSSQEFRDDELPPGVVNCSSMTEAHNGDFIHRRIWELAGDAEPLQVDRHRNPQRRVANYSNRLGMYEARWRGLHNQVHTTLSALTVLSKSVCRTEQTLIRDIARTLKSFGSDRGLPDVLSFLEAIAIVHGAVRRRPDTDCLRSIRSLLHDLQNYSVLRDIESTLRALRRDLPFLQEIPGIAHVEELLGDLDAVTEGRDLVASDLATLNTALGKVRPPEELAQIPSSEQNAKSNYRVVVVEDDEIWSGFAMAAATEIKHQLSASGHSITCECYGNYADARKALPIRKRFRNGTLGASASAPNTIVVVDLHLPYDKNHEKRIRRGVDAARRENGLNLIKYLRSYNSQYPVIVFSNSRTVEDSKLLRGLGIPGEDHLLKQGDRDSLLKALLRHIRTKQIHTVELIELSPENQSDADDSESNNIQGYFKVDGVPIPLTESEKKVLYAICIEDDSFSRSKNLPERKYRIQRKISEELNKAGKYIGPDEIIAPIAGARGRYTLRASFISGDNRINPIQEELEWLHQTESDDAPKNTDPCKVLIVENDRVTCDYLGRELRRLEFEVQMTSSVDQAIFIARSYKPDILLLDFQLPFLSDANPLSWNDYAGLDVLEQVRVFQHDIKAVGFTALAVNDNPKLLNRAESLGLWVDDIVGKNDMPAGGGTPESLLLTKIENLRSQIRRDKQFIVRGLNRPSIEILPRSNLGAGKLRLRINGRDYETGRASPLERLLGFLIMNPNRLVSLPEISDALDVKIPQDLGKKWAERLRSRIRQEWLKLPPTLVDEPEKMILENHPESRGGMRLNARVFGLENMNRDSD